MRRLDHFTWVCAVVSPLTSRERLLEAMPRPIDWHMVFAAASEHLFLPSVFCCLEQKDLLHLVPDEARDALQQVYLLNAARNRMLTGQVKRVSDILDRAGLEPIWLKGAARLIEAPDLAAQRTMFDLDLWLPAEQMEAAAAAMGVAGYRSDLQYPDVGQKHMSPLFHVAESAPIELHWRVVNPEWALILPNNVLHGGARLVQWRGTRLAVPSLDAQILNIVTQSSALDVLQTRMHAHRLLEFTILCAERGMPDSLQIVQTVYAAAGCDSTAERYITLARALFGAEAPVQRCGLPRSFALRIDSPRLYASWIFLADAFNYVRTLSRDQLIRFPEKFTRRARQLLSSGKSW